MTQTMYQDHHKEPGRAMQEMMDSIDRFRGVLAEETSLLAQADTQGFIALQEKKVEAAASYQEKITACMARGEEIKARMTPAVKARLEGLQADFAATVKDNHDMLQRMQKSLNRLGERITDIARNQADKERVSYSASGRMSGEDTKPVSMGIQETA